MFILWSEKISNFMKSFLLNPRANSNGDSPIPVLIFVEAPFWSRIFAKPTLSPSMQRYKAVNPLSVLLHVKLTFQLFPLAVFLLENSLQHHWNGVMDKYVVILTLATFAIKMLKILLKDENQIEYKEYWSNSSTYIFI